VKQACIFSLYNRLGFGTICIRKHLLSQGKESTLNRGIKGTKKLKGPFKENCRCLGHDVQPLHTSITIDVQYNKGRYLYSVKCQLISMDPLNTPIQCTILGPNVEFL